MQIKFITFGSHANYIEAGNRLLDQAEKANIFTETKLYTGDDLKNDNIFWEQHREFIENNIRGYGYWIWKPYLIKKTMETMNNGDVLLFLDCGCEIDYTNKGIFREFVDVVKHVKIIGTFMGNEREWNKMDLIEKLDMNNDKYLDGSNKHQRQSGAILFLVCERVRKMVNEWYDLCCDYHNIDDTPSVIQNLDCFREHRHDQSVFSLLTKKYDMFFSYELTYDNFIYYNRNRDGISKIL